MFRVEVDVLTGGRREVEYTQEEIAATLAQADREAAFLRWSAAKAQISNLEAQQARAVRELLVAQSFPEEISPEELAVAKARILEIERAVRAERQKLAD